MGFKNLLTDMEPLNHSIVQNTTEESTKQPENNLFKENFSIVVCKFNASAGDKKKKNRRKHVPFGRIKFCSRDRFHFVID